jgi:spore coat polysaccharide biosynthesis protein SpsF
VTVAAIIQARMGSTRFPGKITAPLCGRPLLAHVVERARRARCVDRVVIATTTQPRDDEVVELSAALGVDVVRGPEDDVLRRFVIAAEYARADIVVRITGDCSIPG